jgi:hypothetical protein
MAWAVLVVRLPQGTRQVSALPEGYWPPAFEPAAELRARLRGIPGIELLSEEESLAVVRAEDWVVEIDFSTPTRIMLQVEGSDASLEVIRSITRALDAVAIDTTTGEALDWAGDPSSGLRSSRARTEMLDALESSPTNDTCIGSRRR